MSLPTVPKKLVRSTNNQIKKMVDYMTAHPKFAAGDFTGPLGQKKNNEQWAELKDLLKDYGPDKSIEQWRHTWRDLKKKARHENAHIRRCSSSTGNVVDIPVLSDVTEKIINIIGPETSRGLDIPESRVATSDEIPMAIAGTSSEAIEVAEVVVENVTPTPIQTQDDDAPPNLHLPRERRRGGPVSEFARVQENFNEIFRQFSENMYNLINQHLQNERDRNEIERERNKIMKERNDLLKRREEHEDQ